MKPHLHLKTFQKFISESCFLKVFHGLRCIGSEEQLCESLLRIVSGNLIALGSSLREKLSARPMTAQSCNDAAEFSVGRG